ncbi:MAG TPA: TonB-dependent receptor [Bryobacteraceae bacterium]|nr:TonB-dependent receptor [Bryobacteraceae bacterium]
MVSRFFRLSAAVCIAATWFLSGPRLQAQNVAVAQVSGTVTDQSGATLANAQVVMTETDKGEAHSTVTDTRGQYVLPNLPVGQYRLEVKGSGFKNFVENGIILVVNNNVEIDVPMQLGSISESIEVKATANLVETKENSVASVIDEQRINELPLNNRQPTQLIIALGGAVYADSGDVGSKSFWNATRIAVAGGQGNGTAYVFDGADATDAMSNVNMPFPFPDALQEFSIETSAVSSRFGEHPGATVNVVTKSGSNAFHGDLFEYLRNGDLDARNFFSTTGADTLKRNQFGGTAGGKIIRDKLFYFGGFQGTRNRSNPPQLTTHIPTAAMLGGDFSTIASSACGKAVSLLNPTVPLVNGKAPAFSGNQIPKTLLSPVAVGLTKYLPISSANGCGLVTYGIPQTGDEEEYVGRVDYVINSKHTLFSRYFADDWRNPPFFDGKNLLTTTSPGNLELAQEATIGDTYVFGAGTVNSFHVGFNRIRDNRGPTNFPITWTDLGSQMYSAVPNFLLIGSMTGGFTTYCGTCAPGHFNISSYQIADDVDLIRGRHQMAFGFNLVRIQNNTISGFDENGAPTFNGQFTGLGLVDFMLGYMNDFQQTNATPDDLRQWEFSAYAQDSFKVSQRFTLNFGLRWEPIFADPDKYKRGDSFNYSAFLANQVSTLHPSAPPGLFFPGDPGVPAANWNGHYADFGPRVGVVWNPHGDGRDTLRAGAAILFDQAETWFNERETTNPPYGNDIDVGSTGTLTNPWAGYAGGNPFPQHGNLFFPQFGTYINMPINPAPTYVAQWNVTYQRQFGDWLGSISYLGNKTTHLWIAGEVDPAEFLGTGSCTINGVAYPTCSSTSNTNQRRLFVLTNPTAGKDYASVDTMDGGAVAHYEGLLMSATHRLNNNFQMNVNFTDSYCLSDFDFGAALAGSTNSQLFNRHADWGPCISDTRYIFNFSGVASSSFKTGNSFLNHMVNNWQLAPIIQARSGQPLNITSGKDNSLTGLGNDRPNQVMSNVFAANPGCSSSAICVQYLNPTAFVQNPIGTYGGIGRNAVRGPSYIDFDVSLSRTFKLTERMTLQARADAFNILNHTNFVGAFAPSGQPAGASFGTTSQNLSSSNFGQLTGAYDPRILQFAMKMIF